MRDTINSEFKVLKQHSSTELMPQMVVASVVYIIVAVIFLLVLAFLGAFRQLSNAFPENGVVIKVVIAGWDSILALFLFPIVFSLGIMFFLILHEVVHYAVCRLAFKIPARFGAGLLEKVVPYLSVEPLLPVKRNQWIVIAVAPTIVVNALLLALIIWVQENLILYFFFILAYIVHFSGCAGDAVLVHHALKYPSTVYIKDEGPLITILTRKRDDHSTNSSRVLVDVNDAKIGEKKENEEKM